MTGQRRPRRSRPVHTVHGAVGLLDLSAFEAAADSELAQAITRVVTDDAVHATVLVLGDTAPGRPGQAVADACLGAPVPTVAVLTGATPAATLLVAGLCDMRIGSTTSTYGGGSAALDTAVAAMSSALLAELVGAGRVPDLLLGHSEVSAVRAVDIGLVNLLADLDDIIDRALTFADRLAAETDVDVLRAPKRALRRHIRPAVDARPAKRRNAFRSVDSGPRTGETKQRILDAAAKVLSEQGYASSRLSDIATLSGTHQTAVYYYFESKEALVDAVLRVGVTRTFDSVRTAVEGLGPDANSLDRLAAAMRTHLKMVLAPGDYAAAAMRAPRELPPDVLRGLRTAQEDYGRYWSRLFERALDDGALREGANLSVARSFVAGALNYAIEWYRPGKLSVDELADEFVSNTLGGLVSPAGRAQITWSTTRKARP